MREIIKTRIKDVNIYIAVNDAGQLKIGSEFQFWHKRMRTFSINPDMAWFEITDISGYRNQLLHTKVEGGAIMCNLEENLNEMNTEFPYVLLNPVEVLIVKKKLKEMNA